MYPSVMPQSELLAKMEDNAAIITNKSLSLRESPRRNQPTVEDEESSSDSSEESSNSDSATTTLSRRSQQPERQRQLAGRENPRLRSPERRSIAERPTQSRPKSASPAIRRMQRSVSRPGAQNLDSSSSGAEVHNKLGRPRSSTSPPEPQGSKRRHMVRNTSPPAIKPSAPVKPDALSFLDPDSPPVTEEHLRRVIAESSAMWSPRSASSSSSSTNSDSASESHRSMAETDATTPDQSVNGDATPQSRGDSPNRPSRSPTQPPGPLSTEAKEHKYGTPEMARGPAKHPHLPPKDLQPRISAPGQGHAKHLPRAEKLPMSGYELLAAKLSSPDSSRSRRRSYSSNKTPSTEETETAQIRPIYRRFETLNHRLLLHLQDELSELEEQLHRLDTADTQTRRLANCILPASRRAEFMAGGELQWHRTDILGKIGFKLGQYNHVLTTFKETQSLPSASLSDIETYRTYLATQNPIAEIETRFLDPADDLVCLAQVSRGGRASTSSCSSSGSTEDMLTPMPLKMTFGFSEREPSPTAGSGSGSGSGSSRKSSFGFGTSPSPTTRYQSAGERKGEEDVSGKEEVVEDRLQEGGKVGRGRKGPGPGPAGQLAGLAALAIVAPILAFPLVADFVGRMAVVLVVGLAVAALRRKMVDSGLLLGGEVSGRPTEVVVENEGMVLVGVYAGVMAVIALLF